ncbi:PAS domain-containing protein [Hyphomonas sp. UBA5107]|jgi:hypothetical protein|uniref:PAS domain-containing protein n=1 Tax=Hyphomonas sp. UBA5107 TaxID=1946636 RepID=UPI000C4C1C6D|nr:PAS domain-containing protein [Hyphomonas sp. UBA5107]MAN67428.1 hypothetical protein [Hyphomonadaceae bacterium]MBA30162.1 hypothetical protein [Hyphomonadaceae bacterium]|tara:strand:- start:1556 stop:2059 length:504 start_codon:yes stop_codon:yes gene_type:complete
MSKQNVFKGVTDSQQKLIEYWCSLRDSHGLVRRESMDPGQFRAMLASISIVEFDRFGTGRFRIAGSRLRQIFGMEARGRQIEDVLGEHGEAYCLGLAAALERGAPVGGVIEQEDGRMHAWVRLPLAGRDGQLRQVLCHDELVRARPKKGRPDPAGDDMSGGHDRAAA